MRQRTQASLQNPRKSSWPKGLRPTVPGLPSGTSPAAVVRITGLISVKENALKSSSPCHRSGLQWLKGSKIKREGWSSIGQTKDKYKLYVMVSQLPLPPQKGASVLSSSYERKGPYSDGHYFNRVNIS